jgi:hypothetical protein
VLLQKTGSFGCNFAIERIIFTEVKNMPDLRILILACLGPLALTGIAFPVHAKDGFIQQKYVCGSGETMTTPFPPEKMWIKSTPYEGWGKTRAHNVGYKRNMDSDQEW